MRFVFFLFFCTIALTVNAQQRARAKKPNIIVILTDDAGYSDFGAYGGKEIPTPQIDKIAEEGVRFTDAYVTASVCAPSRAGVMTGRYQQRFGFEHNPSGVPAPGFTVSDMGLDTAQTTMADVLKQSGYRTAAIGKWHLGHEEKYHPQARGFDDFFGFLGGHRRFFGDKHRKASEEALLDNHREIPEDSITYLTDMFTDKAISFIGQDKSQPFFIYLAYNAVHTPMDAKKEHWNRFAHIADTTRRSYAAMMTSLDDNIGKLMVALKENAIDENTLVFFVNDNGGATNNGSDNGPLRGLKGSKWEGGIRVAMMMKWPGKLSHQKQFTQPVSTLDLLPTCLAAAGGSSSLTKGKDGVNLLPFITRKKKKAPHKLLYWRRGVAAAIRQKDWKLIRVTGNPVLLFDLKKDLSETRNVAEQNPAVVKRLLKKLAAWERGLASPHWGSSFGNENQILKHRMNVVGRAMERKYP